MITEQEKQRRIAAAEKRVNNALDRIEKLNQKLTAAKDELARQSEQLEWISNAPTSG